MLSVMYMSNVKAWYNVAKELLCLTLRLQYNNIQIIYLANSSYSHVPLSLICISGIMIEVVYKNLCL